MTAAFCALPIPEIPAFAGMTRTGVLDHVPAKNASAAAMLSK